MRSPSLLYVTSRIGKLSLIVAGSNDFFFFDMYVALVYVATTQRPSCHVLFVRDSFLICNLWFFVIKNMSVQLDAKRAEGR